MPEQQSRDTLPPETGRHGQIQDLTLGWCLAAARENFSRHKKAGNFLFDFRDEA